MSFNLIIFVAAYAVGVIGLAIALAWAISYLISGPGMIPEDQKQAKAYPDTYDPEYEHAAQYIEWEGEMVLTPPSPIPAEPEAAPPPVKPPLEKKEPPPKPKEAEPVEEGALPPKEQLIARLKKGLRKTREGLIGNVEKLILGAKAVDQELFSELEEALVTADMGIKTSLKILKNMQASAERDALKSPEEVKRLLREEITRILSKVQVPLATESAKPYVIMVLGVNGTGKTTTIGKLAAKLTAEGKKVVLGAADTFRAAAVEQLANWADRVDCDLIKHKSGADPGAVAFDTLKAAHSRKADVVIVDTAGRLHTRKPLMDELKKIRRILARECEGAPHETLLVLDSTTGQNAIAQVETFKKELEITGLVLTKLDGTAKGGVIVGISEQFGLPIRFIGIGEGIDDLREFNAEEFVEALF